MKTFLAVLSLFVGHVNGQTVGYSTNDYKADYGGSVTNSQSGTFTYIYGALGGADATWSMSEGNAVCYGGLSCADVTTADEDTIPNLFVAQGGLSAITKDNSDTTATSLSCDGYMSCAGVSSTGTAENIGYLRCYGLGACAYRSFEHDSRSSVFDFFYSTLGGYQTSITTTDTDNTRSILRLRGTFAGYGATYTCTNNCTVDCNDNPNACYNMRYICNDGALCRITGCDNSEKNYCPTFSGSFINLDGLSESEYDASISSDERDGLESFAEYLIDTFLMTSNEILTLDIENYYDDMCYVNCGNRRDGHSESWSGSNFNTECDINTGGNDICFTGEETGRFATYNFNSLGDDFDVYVDGDDSVDTTELAQLGRLTKVFCRSDQSCQDMHISNGGSELNCMGSDSCMWAITDNVPVIRIFNQEAGYDGEFDNVQVAMAFEYGSFDYASITTPGDGSTCTLVLSAGKWTAYDLTYTCSSGDTCNIYWYGNSEFSQSQGNVNFNCNGLCVFYDNDYSWVDDSDVTSAIAGSRTSSSSNNNNDNSNTGMIIGIAIGCVLLVIVIIIAIVVYCKKYKRGSKDQKVGLLDADAENAKAYEPITMGK